MVSQIETEADRHRQRERERERERQTDLQTERHDAVISRFSQFCKALMIENPIVTFGILCK